MPDLQPTAPLAPPGPQPRGWYLDPNLAPRERWWTGTEWSEFTHRKATKNLFGPDYQRAFWPGPNRFATKSWIFTLITVGLYAVAFIAASLGIPGTGSQPAIWTGVVVCAAGVLGVVTGIMSIVFGVRATRLTATSGGTGLAIVGIFIGFTGGGFGLFFVGFGVIMILGATGTL
jgi:Protein of unknown function (DUF2510)